jgi:hypothetical protein
VSDIDVLDYMVDRSIDESNSKAKPAQYRWDSPSDPMQCVLDAQETSRFAMRKGYGDTDRIVSSELLALMQAFELDTGYDAVKLNDKLYLLKVKK